MRTFNVTFNGEVLEDHDPAEVRERLADLFDIRDDETAQTLFSGEIVCLRCDLDRKTAADYFKRLQDVGAVAQLEPAEQRLTRPSAPRLDYDGDGGATLVRDMQPEAEAENSPSHSNASQVWPVSRARQQPSRSTANSEETNPPAAYASKPETPLAQDSSDSSGKDNSAPTEDGPPQDTANHAPALTLATSKELPDAGPVTAVASSPGPLPEATVGELNGNPAANDAQTVDREERERGKEKRLQLVLTSTQKELERLENQAQQAQQDTDNEIERLRRRQAQFEADAAQQVAELNDQRHEEAQRAEQDIARLTDLEERALAGAQAEIAQIRREREQHEQTVIDQRAAIQARAADQSSQRENETEQLKAKILATQEEAAGEVVQLQADIARLQQAIEEAREREEKLVSSLQEQLDAMDDLMAEDAEDFRRQETDLEYEIEDQLADFAEREDAAHASAQDKAADLQQQRQQAVETSSAEQERLRGLQQEIDAKRELSMTSVDKACRLLQEQTQDTLKKIDTLGEHVRRRRNRALTELRIEEESPVSQAANPT
ncbi:MAG: hypothetical protein AAGA91_00105 [Pseudomonadota bacterium]